MITARQTSGHRAWRMGSAAVFAAVLLAGCSTSRFDSQQRVNRAPQQLTPVTSSTVQSQSLPPIGADGSTTANTTSGFPNNSGDPALIDQTANADGSFVSLDDFGSNTTASGRDLSSPLTVTKLLGAWDVVAGGSTCRLNLTQTTKSGTSRYRASTPGCAIPAMANVASWQLAGTQIQLYDESGAIVGSLLQSGNRFIGTMSGGVAVSMAG